MNILLQKKPLNTTIKNRKLNLIIISKTKFFLNSINKKFFILKNNNIYYLKYYSNRILIIRFFHIFFFLKQKNINFLFFLLFENKLLFNNKFKILISINNLILNLKLTSHFNLKKLTIVNKKNNFFLPLEYYLIFFISFILKKKIKIKLLRNIIVNFF